jgi:indole-3-glycerol phosphate synthase
MTVLDDIIAATRRTVAESRTKAKSPELERLAAAHVPRGFRKALQRASEAGVAVIAELKKASPSRGLIRGNFDPAALAHELEEAGAAALSVLTDEEYFQGSLQNLQIASSSTALPCLRKDFIIDEFQVLEARANQADAVLLIVRILGRRELRFLAERARAQELDVLCEVHDEDELQQALDAGCNLIGINSRDLRTFKVELNTAFKLAERIPQSVLAVAESGIRTGADIVKLREVGYRGFLVGEQLMRMAAPGKELRTLLAEAASLSTAAK